MKKEARWVGPVLQKHIGVEVGLAHSAILINSEKWIDVFVLEHIEEEE